MKLYEGRAATANVIRSYGPDGVTIGAQHYALPLLLTASHVETGLEGRSPAELTESDLSRILEQSPNIVLAGGAREPLPVPATLRQALESRRIAVEAMQLGAACRTFNVLVQEDRAVLALLFP